jgi:hypothetical protein
MVEEWGPNQLSGKRFIWPISQLNHAQYSIGQQGMNIA